MAGIGELALSNTLFSFALATIAWAVHRQGHYPALAHVLWVLVLLKAISPPLLLLPISMGGVTAAPAVVDPSVMSGDAATTAGIGAAVAGLGQYAVPVLLVAWLTGSVAVLITSVRRIRDFGRLLGSTSVEVPPSLLPLAASVARELGLRSVPPLQLTSARISPMTWWSRGRVRVILPATLLGQVDDAELRWVLAHELAHIRRRDHLVRWIEWLACVACWWNPVVWWARHNLRLDEEDACDALVLERVAGAARAYAGTLLDVVEILARPIGSMPAMATGMDAARSLEHRLSTIISARTRRPAPGPLVAGVSTVAVAFMALGMGSAGGSPVAEEDQPASGMNTAVELSAGSDLAVGTRHYATVSAALPVGMTLADDTYIGTAGADSYSGSAASEIIRGRGGADELRAGRGRDRVDGGDGPDTIHGGAGRDTLKGGSGDDVIDGGAGRDRIRAGGGDDIVRTWSDGTPDQVDCGPGDDRAVVDSTDTTRRCETVVVREPA